MKNKHLALFMALIMCFSLVFGAAAATEGEQIVPTSAVSPTEKDDIADKVGDIVGGIAGEQMSQVGDDLKEGAGEALGTLDTAMNVIDIIRILLANFINAIFAFFGIGGDSSIF